MGSSPFFTESKMRSRNILPIFVMIAENSRERKINRRKVFALRRLTTVYFSIVITLALMLFLRTPSSHKW